MDEAALYVRLMLGFLLVSTGLSKYQDMGTHMGIVKDYKILPSNWINYFAYGEVYMEFFLGAILIVGLFNTIASLGTMLLLSMYTIAIAINLFRGRREMSCGCGGLAGNHKLSWWLVLRNGLLIAAIGFVFKTNSEDGSLEVLLTGASFAEVFGYRTWEVSLLSGISLLGSIIVNEMSAIRESMRKILGG